MYPDLRSSQDWALSSSQGSGVGSSQDCTAEYEFVPGIDVWPHVPSQQTLFFIQQHHFDKASLS